MGDDIDRSNWTEKDYQAERLGEDLANIATGGSTQPDLAPISNRSILQFMRLKLRALLGQFGMMTLFVAILVAFVTIMATVMRDDDSSGSDKAATAGVVTTMSPEVVPGSPVTQVSAPTLGSSLSPGATTVPETSTSTSIPTTVVPTQTLVLGADPASGEAVGGTLTEHLARVVLNIPDDEFTAEAQARGLIGGWFSSYKDEAELWEGQIAVDLEAGTISGEIVEHWSCTDRDEDTSYDGSCRDRYDYFDTYLTVFFSGHLEPEDFGWTVVGTADIAYDAAAGWEESPSQCNGVDCYHCIDRYCSAKGDDHASVPLGGTLRRESLSLEYVDQLELDVSTMDFDPLWRTEFFMSRFAMTWQLAEPLPSV